MFSCLWQLWDWLDLTSMENKKGGYQHTSINLNNENHQNEAIPKHLHQHNTAPQHLRLLQYGLKIPNHQHPQLNQTHTHQQLNSPLHFHVHQPQGPPQIHRHLEQTNQQIYQTNSQFIYQYPQKNNQSIYQTNQPPPPLHPHSQIIQNSPQIWVPHQPPLHYHQYQNKNETQKTNNPQQQQQQQQLQQPQQQQISNNKSKEIVERKKSSSGNNNSQLRSPSAKRPLEAPVTMQGWLHKQGSDGLMLWKKRWFVLSEYCLFYYKGPEEEKLLGSILLPSYKVSICGPDDKVNKKFAFKCEHANMRTYILAADSQELMLQWIRVLNLACLLQSNVENDQQSGPSVPSTYNQSTENSDSGFHQQFQQSTSQNSSTTPVHMHSSSNTTDFSNPSQQELSQYNQPLYANAPPKPRRLNDGSYSSPSPDVLERYPTHLQTHSQYLQPPPPIHNIRMITKSPINLYGQVNSQSPQPEYVQQNRLKHNNAHDNNNLFTPTREIHNMIPINNVVERRTPDTYGRSKLNPNKTHPTDYEDIYPDQAMYKRPLSPIAYNYVKKINPVVNPAYRTYTPVNMLGPKDLNQCEQSVQLRKSPNNTIITRPHSADFLEYELNHRHLNSNVLNKQQPRPKSSLDINRNTTDNDFYSEERYAEKMRKSAQYLPKMPRYQPVKTNYICPDNFALMRSNTQPLNFHNLHINERHQRNQQPIRSRSVLSEGSLSRELDTDLRPSPIDRQTISPTIYNSRQDHLFNCNEDLRNRMEIDQFTRSASARLTQNQNNDGRSMNRDGDRKREESMKRLLEWKQRMLQSPLNRKVQGNSNKNYSVRPDFYYKNNESEYLQKNQSHYSQETRRSVNNLPQYNSYSSDDEENEERSKENVQSQAGRTLDTYPSNSESHTPAQIISATVLNTLKETDKSLTQLDNNNMHDVKTTHCTIDNNNKKLLSDVDACDDNSTTFTKPLVQFNKESSTIAQVSSLRSEYSDKFEQTPVITEIRSNGALVKSILAEFEKKSEQSDKDIDSIIEENYMTMTPKKCILAPCSSINSDATVIFNELDENPYVEMNQSIDINFLDLNDDTNNNNRESNRPYEMVCFSDGKLEPVYMELKQPEKQNINNKELPDILISQQTRQDNNKSDSSDDADDEASKDLDSLDTPSHPRFSLSDNFRPASYYLGASQTVPEFQDSSDSELVSPPPIPTSPPPLEDFENTDESITVVMQDKESIKKTHSDDFFNLHNMSKKQVGFLSSSLKDQQDSSSICSIDLEQRFESSRLSSHNNSDSDIELRLSLPLNSDYERMLKRRPVSEEFCDELESMDSNFNETLDSTDLDKYLNDLQISNITNDEINQQLNNLSLNYHDYENLFVLNYDDKNLIGKPSQEMSASSSKNTTLQSDDDFIQRCRPESSASTSAEICGLLQNSNRSTPSIRISSSLSVQEIPTISQSYFSDRRDKSLNSSFNQPAPYYYSDLSMNTSNTDSTSTILTLNNQRGGTMIGNKRDIMHIINPIKCNGTTRNILPHRNIVIDNRFKLAAEARSVSVDFLNLTDKSGKIDKKNIYESDTLKRLKTTELNTTRNLYPKQNEDKFNTLDNANNNNNNKVRRSHSLEGLLENVLSDVNVQNIEEIDVISEENSNNTNTEGSYLWEEDSIWYERLRSASQRHTKSMDNLDSIGDNKKLQQKKSPRGIIRGVTYVNDNIYNLPVQNKHKKDIIDENKSHQKNEIKKEGSFLIDREKLRQWDLLSSAPSDDQLSIIAALQGPKGDNNTVVELVDGSTCEQVIESTTTIQDAASGSISINTRDTFPRAITAKKIWIPNSQTLQSRSITNLTRTHDNNEHYRQTNQQNYYGNQESNQYEVNSEILHSYNSRKENWQLYDKMSVSAGELLGRTHEELVLLLIQLRRQSANTLQAIENCYNEIDTIQAQLHLMDQAKRLENLQKLEQIKQHLLELEKQYEKGKPLVNLVDNMVKLGSLYRSPSDRNNVTPYIRDRLEFNQQIQERRLLAEEKRDWNRLNPNHLQLQEKVQQLYQLDRLIQEESGTLQNLQQDKEEIERALGGLRLRLNKGYNDPIEIEQARKKQANLENELSRVHLMLAQNSKKLEETVAGNARLEQELLVLKQKLQISRQQRSSPQFSNAGDSLPCVVGTSAMLESDLQRVQQKVGDLQKQRQELSMQVRQLTDRSNNLQQQIKPTSSSSSSSCVSSQNNLSAGNKKKINSLWRETDLDTMNIVDHGESSAWNTIPTTPLYINTDLKQQNCETDYYSRSDSTSDEIIQNIPSEKQEIKTVRIVKRESERRQRDREKTITGTKWDALLEEDDSSQSILYRPTTTIQQNKTQTNLIQQSTNFNKVNNDSNHQNFIISSPNLALPGPSTTVNNNNVSNSNLERSPELSPIFKSEAARQIITEMATPSTSSKQTNRRTIPKEKRRHYTAPHNNLIMKSLHQLPTDDNAFDKMIVNNRRARDDLDMERALRQRIDAPDVVRSTLSNKELKYNESTIDNILGTPNKINIPERYIPEQLPQLSAEEQEHRLRKVESIKKMLSDTTILSTSSTNISSDDKNCDKTSNTLTNKATTKMIEEKKQREHLLQLNQILAKQVMEMSKIVAVKALATLPLQTHQISTEEEDSSPVTPLPLYQQRDNFYS